MTRVWTISDKIKCKYNLSGWTQDTFLKYLIFELWILFLTKVKLFGKYVY